MRSKVLNYAIITLTLPLCCLW